MNKLVIVIFISFTSGLGLLNVLVKDRSFSEQENRVLAQMPTFTFEKFLSGEFTKEVEAYISDQFVGKDFWVRTKAKAEKLLQKQENNGVYVGSDGFLLEPFEKPGEQFGKNLNSIQYFVNKTEDVTTYFLLAPTSVDIYQEKLPKFAPTFGQRDVLASAKEQLAASSRLQFIDVYDELLSHKDESLYFRTDHHWTMRGAYYAYRSISYKMGIAPYEKNEFDIGTVSENFYGTLYSKANALLLNPDKIEVFQPKFEIDHHVQYEDGRRTDTLYEWSHLDKRDQYALFLDGNHSLVKIQSNIANGRKLAVLKDSYAHSLIPFLANHFEEIHVIDLRYNHMNIGEYLKRNEIEKLLFLYNIANFSDDTNLIWLQQ